MSGSVYIIGYGRPGSSAEAAIVAKDDRAKRLAEFALDFSIYGAMRCDASQAQKAAEIMKRKCDSIPDGARVQTIYKSAHHAASVRKDLDLNTDKKFGDWADLECRIQGLDPKNPSHSSTFLVYLSGEHTLEIYAMRKSGNPKHRNFELKNVNKVVQEFNLKPKRVIGGGEYSFEPALKITGPVLKYGSVPPQFALDVGKALLNYFKHTARIKVDIRYDRRNSIHKLWGFLGYRWIPSEKVTADIFSDPVRLFQEDGSSIPLDAWCKGSMLVASEFK